MVSGWQQRQRWYPSTLSPTSAPSDHPTQPIPKQPTYLPSVTSLRASLIVAVALGRLTPHFASPRRAAPRRAAPSFRASPSPPVRPVGRPRTSRTPRTTHPPRPSPHPPGSASASAAPRRAAPRRHGPARHPHSARPLRPASTWDARRGCEVADNAEIPPRRGSWLSVSQPRAYERVPRARPRSHSREQIIYNSDYIGHTRAHWRARARTRA